MSETSLNLSMPYIQEGQAQKHVTHNEALELLDALVQLAVDGRSDTVPDGPAHGARWIVGPAPEGDWAGHADAVAVWHGSEAGGRWTFLVPNRGWTAWIGDEEQARTWDGASWRVVGGLPDQVDRLGVGTPPDGTNRLAVGAAGTLLTHDGTDHRVTINKAGAGDTASLLFQSGWSGRAEMGLTGSDDFAFKVSADGGSWTTALTFDAGTGTAGGAAVQQASDDVTPGRLMRADWGYGPGNLLGAVDQVGGVPTGAVIESGRTAEGDFVRYADGTQICSAVLTLAFDAASQLTVAWTFPKAFDGGTPSFVGGTLDAADALANATPGLEDLGPLMALDTDPLGTRFLQTRVRGGTDFAGTDDAEMHAIAVGRWF
ncbi:MAG: DUF2793 domain-containing protein [Pseudomonadota bacterium]